MATRIDSPAAARTGRGFMADQGFFVRYAVVLAIFILFGFAQFAMRGFSSFSTAPFLVHVHGALMIGWLTVFIAQNLLVHRGELGVHRALGWASVGLLAAITATGLMVGYNAVALERVPPFFGTAYFLALTWIGTLAFAGTVAWGLALRKQVQWHRRAMLGSMFFLLEPALGRLLPMPLLGGWGEWATFACQLLFVGVLARHDRTVLAAVHPATKIIALLLFVSHVLLETLSRVPQFVAFAESVAAG
jgi:hypothetical protein